MSTVHPPFEVMSQAQEIKFATANVQPPSNLYIGREDVGSITSFCSATGLTLEVHGRVIRPDGQVIPFVQTHIPNSDRTAKTNIFALPEGFLLNIAVFLAAGSAKRGQCYVVVKMGRGDLVARIDHQVILQGYVGTAVNQAWPGNRLEQPTEGPGMLRVIIGTLPAAGAEIAETTPTGARWRLRALYTSFAASATVATRHPSFRLLSAGGSPFIRIPALTTITANASANLSLGEGCVLLSDAVTAEYLGPLPSGITLMAGFQIISVTSAIQAGDQFQAPQYEIEEWIEP